MAMINELSPPRGPGGVSRILNWMAGVDEETLLLCPGHDKDCVRTIAFLMIGVWCYQAGLFSLVLHRMLADDGTIHWELLLVSAFVASMILLIDSFMVMRSGWHLHGISELKRGGLDISGGWGPQVRNGIFLSLRIVLSLGIAQLTAIFTALILFHPDIVAELDRVYFAENAPLIASVTAQIDGELQRASAAVDIQNQRVTGVDTQLASMRRGTVDPAANDAEVKIAQDEVSQLNAERSKRAAELAAAQTFSANEIAGIKGDAGNSGKPGAGPVRAGAEERLQAAKAALATAEQSLAAARARLDTVRKQMVAVGGDRIRQAEAQLPALEKQAVEEAAQLAALRGHLADLTKNREGAIRAGVESAPNHVGHDNGLLAQVVAIRHVAQDSEIAIVILLIDVTSFGLELAAVLAKVTSFIPTTYSALLARNSYMRTVAIVNGMEESLNRRPRTPEVEVGEPIAPMKADAEDDEQEEVEEVSANDNVSDRRFSFGPEIEGDGDDPPPKRPRGRPRRVPVT